MGKKQNLLISWLGGTSENLPLLKLSDLMASDYRYEIVNVFRLLGGKNIEYSAPGGYDMFVPSINALVELDERQHFNRYRSVTLSSSVYEQLGHFPIHEYRSFCKEYEKRCPAKMGWWSSSGANKLFGPPAPDGIHEGNGPTRWKLRAYYDFLKDIGQFLHGIPVIRISVYDTVTVNEKQVTIEKILDKQIMEGRESIRNLVVTRLHQRLIERLVFDSEDSKKRTPGWAVDGLRAL